MTLVSTYRDGTRIYATGSSNVPYRYLAQHPEMGARMFHGAAPALAHNALTLALDTRERLWGETGVLGTALALTRVALDELRRWNGRRVLARRST